MGLFGLLPSLAVVAAVVYGMARLLGAGPSFAGSSHRGDFRGLVSQLFRLALLLASVVLVAEGVAGLMAHAWPRSGELLADPAALARSLAFTVAGVPALSGLALWTRHRLAVDANESGSSAWALYVTLAAGLGLLVAMPAWYSLLSSVGLAGALEGSSVGRSLTWTGVWVVHWRLGARGRRPESPVGIDLLFGSALGLFTLALGVGLALLHAWRVLYDAAFLTLVANGASLEVRRSVAAATIGAVVWWWYWLRNAVGGTRSGGWYVFVLLVGVLGGLVTAVIGTARLVHAGLIWVFADPAAATAAMHFELVPGALATISVGLASWRYHRGVLGPRGTRDRRDVEAVYQYLAAGVGLVVIAVAVTLAIAALLEAIAVSDQLAVGRPVANAVVRSVTLMILGLPVWAVFWRRAQRNAAIESERRALTRRVYLLVLLGTAASVALVSLVVLLIVVFEDMARGQAGVETVLQMRIPLGLVLTTGVVAAYHALVYREDRIAVPETGRSRCPVREVVLFSAAGEAAAKAIAEELGIRVRLWCPVVAVDLSAAIPGIQPFLTFGELDSAAVLDAVRAGRDARLLVLARPEGGFDVVPFVEA